MFVVPFNHFSQTGSGRSTISHFTFGSFSFDRVNGRRMAIARWVALTSRSHAQRTLLAPVSLPNRFEIVYAPGSISVKYAVPFRSVMIDKTLFPELASASLMKLLI